MSDTVRCTDLLTQGETRWSIPLPSSLPNASLPKESLLRALAAAFLAGDPSPEPVAARGALLLGRAWRFLPPLARRYVAAFAGKRPGRQDVVRFLRNDERLQKACLRHAGRVGVANWIVGRPGMQPRAAASAWPVRPVETLGALAAWLALDAGELAWLADLRGLERSAATRELRHYNYRAVAKKTGGMRLIESPKPRLKAVQRAILAEILGPVPPHPAVHGFVRGRSIQSFAAPHVGRHVVLRMDLRDFFPSVSRARVQAVFRTLGYPELVANALGGICTNTAPSSAWRAAQTGPAKKREGRELYGRPHLPQGAPTSPALANLCAHRLDCRLGGMAETAGARYTRYADDLAFSGAEEFARCAERFATHAAAIAAEEGFAINFRKTRVMRRAVRQHLAGLVVNDRLNLKRTDLDSLKALLTNCVRHGPTGQNRENHPYFRAHLEGRVSFVASVHAGRGDKLRGLLARIDWTM